MKIAVTIVVILSAAGFCVAEPVAMNNSASQPTTQPTTQPAAAPIRISLGQAAVLGVVEGLTEYLPVSSTGHLILAGHAMGLSRFTDKQGTFGRGLQKTPAVDAFEIVIQLGAILAVLGLYRRRVGRMCLGLVGKDTQGRRLLAALLVAFLPAAVIGLALHKPIKEHLFGPVTVCWALVIGGLLLIVVERWWKRRPGGSRTTDVSAVTMRQAMIIGMAQCLAMWPGTSRSMITILAALLVGLDMMAAAEFSFLLALPTLGAATLYEAAKSGGELLACAGADGLLVGLIVSGVVAAIAVKGFVKWLTGHGLWPFGVYRVLIGAGLYAYYLVS